MRERLFPRWGAALFALLPLAELLYCGVSTQTAYAAAIASLITALIVAGAAKLAPFMRQYRVPQWALAVFALWPLCRSLSRMAVFLQKTLFVGRSLWGLIFALTVSALLIARVGQIRTAMWALPIAAVAMAVCVLSGVLTVADLRVTYLEAPQWGLWGQTGEILNALLPAALVLALTLPEGLSGAAARGMSAGGALLALLCLRTALLLGAHTAALLPYPNFTAAGLAAVGDFARHGEVFFAVPLILCDLGRSAALSCAVLAPMRRLTARKNKQHA